MIILHRQIMSSDKSPPKTDQLRDVDKKEIKNRFAEYCYMNCRDCFDKVVKKIATEIKRKPETIESILKDNISANEITTSPTKPSFTIPLTPVTKSSIQKEEIDVEAIPSKPTSGLKRGPLSKADEEKVYKAFDERVHAGDDKNQVIKELAIEYKHSVKAIDNVIAKKKSQSQDNNKNT